MVAWIWGRRRMRREREGLYKRHEEMYGDDFTDAYKCQNFSNYTLYLKNKSSCHDKVYDFLLYNEIHILYILPTFFLNEK